MLNQNPQSVRLRIPPTRLAKFVSGLFTGGPFTGFGRICKVFVSVLGRFTLEILNFKCVQIFPNFIPLFLLESL